MVSNWSFDACRLLYLLNDTESLVQDLQRRVEERQKPLLAPMFSGMKLLFYVLLG